MGKRTISLCKELNEKFIDKVVKEEDLIQLTSSLGVLLNSFEFMESGIYNFEECEGIIFDEQFPEYMGRMLIISGLARKRNYYSDIAARIIKYIENGKYEELLTLVVIHHGNNFVEIAKIVKDKIIATEDENLIRIENDVLGLDTFLKFILTEGDETNEEITEDKEDIEHEEILEGHVQEIEDEENAEDDRDVGKTSEQGNDSIASYGSDYDGLSSNLKCLSYTEKEYGTEVKMGTFEYNYTANYHNGDWIKLNDLCIELKRFENDLDSILEYPPRFTCSRYHPITDSTDPFASSNKNSLSLLTILEYIQSLSEYKLRWELLYKLFLPIPQWRRQELAQLYCEKISEKILKLCDEPTKVNYDEVLTEAFTEILINFEMSSDIVSSFVKKFKKCGKKFFETPSNESQNSIQNNNIVHEGDRKNEGAKTKGLPEYMKRMLIITGFAGNEQYMEDTTNRIINYIFSEKFEELLSLVLIHYGNDFVRLLQFLGEKMKKYKVEGKILQSEFSKTSIEDVGLYTQKTNEMGGKLNELEKKKEEIIEEMKKKTGTEEEEKLKNELNMLEEDEKNLMIKFNELQMKNRLKSDIREYDGNFKIRKRKLGNNEVVMMKLQNEQENLDKENSSSRLKRKGVTKSASFPDNDERNKIKLGSHKEGSEGLLKNSKISASENVLDTKKKANVDKDGRVKHKKHASLSKINLMNPFEKSGKKLSNSASFPQAVWELLAKYLVPLPRWKRQEVFLNTCRDLNVIASETCRNENCSDKQENHNEELTKCLNGLFFGEKNAGFAGINKGAKDKFYKKAAKIFINMIEEKPKVLGKILFEQIESKNPDFKLIYEILFARPRHEIKPIIKNTNKYYPFMEAVEKIYNKNHNLLLEDNNSEKPLLEKHLKLKKKLNKDKGIKQVYEMLIKRVDAINRGVGIVDEVEMDENQKPSEGTHQKERPREFNKFYWEQLKEIMLISGLTEDKTNYSKRIEKEFAEINKNGKYKEIRKFVERLRMFQREIPTNLEDMPDSEIKKKYFYDENKGLYQRIDNIVDKVVDKIDIDEVKINKNYAEVMKNDGSEETISASAPANSPPDTPHDLNNDKDLKEANENGKLKPSPRSIFGSKGNALKSLQPEPLNEKSPKSPILKKLVKFKHKSTVTPPQPRIFSLADPNFTFISYPSNNGNGQNLGKLIQDLSNVKNGFTDKDKEKKEKRGKSKQPETNGYNNYSSTSSCHPDLLKDAIEYVSPKGKKKDANPFDFLKNFDDSKTPSSTNEFIPDGIDFVLPIEQHNGTEHSTPKLASPNYDNDITNHNVNGFSDEACLIIHR
uniref:Uncharacterized protein n=1 Tax=Meloidogyne javanica TaxID=6303 RepID=A0A915MXX2_MELJA